MRKGINFTDITVLDRLSYIGKYGMGALSYETVFENIYINDKDIVLNSLAASYDLLKGNSTDLLDVLLALEGSSAGARPKAMIQINDEGKIIYGSRNKDESVHINSATGMTHSDFRLPSLDSDDLLALTLYLTKDTTQQHKMFRLACFNLFTHNRDDHAKNFSFLINSNNNWKLAPAYDLTFSYGLGGEHRTTYFGEDENTTMKYLQKLAKKYDIQESDTAIEHIRDTVYNFEKYAKQAGLSENIMNNS